MLQEISAEVFAECILPHIDFRDVGALSMQCKSLKGICDDQEVWKELYIRTTSPKILDTSVHIGIGWQRCWLRKNTNTIYYRRNKEDEDDIPVPLDPCELLSKSYRNRWTPLSQVPSCRCTWSLGLTFPSIQEAFPVESQRYTRNKESEYLEVSYEGVLREMWKAHNKELGLSTVNLCQCIRHYDYDTLGLKGSKRNYKSYKKMVLKKELTKKKKAVKPAKDGVERQKYTVERLKRQLKRELKLLEKKEVDAEKAESVVEKLDAAVAKK